MIHPDTTLRMVSKKIGLGVYATRLIPKGTIVYAKDSLEIEIHPNDPRLMEPGTRDIIELYSYTEPTGMRVLSWDLAKYVNHSCDPNTVSTGYGFEIAIRDIQAGEQVTDDYGLLNIERPMKCSCRTLHCRKYIRPDDAMNIADHWDTVIRIALAHLHTVQQPLAPILDPVTNLALENYFADNSQYCSVLELYREPMHTHDSHEMTVIDYNHAVVAIPS